VTKLEAVVVELQDSLRDAKQETAQANNERQHILSHFQTFRHEVGLREQSWKEAWVKQLPEIPLPVSSPSELEDTYSSVPSASPCLDPNLPNNYQAKTSSRPMISPQYVPRELVHLSDDAEHKHADTSNVLKSDRTYDEGKLLIDAPQSLWPDMERAQVSPRLLTKNGASNIPRGASSAPATNNTIKLPSKRKSPPSSPHSQDTSCSSTSSTPPGFDSYMQNGVELRATSTQLNSKYRSTAFSLPNFAEMSAGIAGEELGATATHFGAGSQAQGNVNGYNDCLPIELSQRSGTPPISNTLAVIKATAFGALRRNRSQRRRGDSHATKVALEALEARGLGLGLQPTMTLSSAHSVHHDSTTSDVREELMALENSLSEEQSL